MRDEMERKGLISPGFPGRCTCGSGATGAHLRGAAARLSRPARSRFVPLFLNGKGFNPEAISMQSHEAIAVRTQPSAPAALFSGRNLRPRPSWSQFGDGALESEEFGPSGVLN